MQLGNGINQSALNAFEELAASASDANIKVHTGESGRWIDCGVEVAGGLQAGVLLAKVCMAGKADVQIVGGDRQVWKGPWVRVRTDHPVEACMLGQYAGWPVQDDGEFFAMGSGPMRVQRGKEELLKSLHASDDTKVAVGTLECDKPPSPKLMMAMAQECDVAVSDLCLAVAPTRSIAGCVQVVARSIETALHKLHELGFALEQVQSGFGLAPLCPPTPDFAKGIGRTNDAILYGGHVSLWVDADDEQIESLGPKLPSCASKDFGKPFADIFKGYNYDFYKVDPGLFSPAEVTIVNLRSGRSWCFGEWKPELIRQSFGTV